MANFWYDAIKRYYRLGYYSNENMKVFVEAERITKEQFKEITNEDYNKEIDSLKVEKQL